ncbi:hypothetical protein ACH5RR_023901 [Cinchona calisaya]|uniref:Xylanase inhibitor N-terminal domain-containing protein n=1 Tax=Cinchona calisaya TaxID=153742 RepID=A0ABD2ZDD6_9GENT
MAGIIQFAIAFISFSIACIFLLSTPFHGLEQKRIVTRLIHHQAYDSPYFNSSSSIDELAQRDLEISIHRINYLSETSGSIKKDSIQGVIFSNLAFPLFLVQFDIGTPPKDQAVAIDTDSTLLWVKCGMVEDPGAGQLFDNYKPGESSTYSKYVRCDKYCDGAMVIVGWRMSVGESKRHKWTNSSLKELVQWERASVELEIGELYISRENFCGGDLEHQESETIEANFLKFYCRDQNSILSTFNFPRTKRSCKKFYKLLMLENGRSLNLNASSRGTKLFDVESVTKISHLINQLQGDLGDVNDIPFSIIIINVQQYFYMEFDLERKRFLSTDLVDLFSWTSIISGLAFHRRGNQELELSDEMVASGLIPNKITFLAVL